MTPTGYFLSHLWLIPLFPLATAALMLFFGKRLPEHWRQRAVRRKRRIVFRPRDGRGASIAHRGPRTSCRPANHVRMAHTRPDADDWRARHPVCADWGFLLDPLSCVMVLVVTGVGFLIHVYSIGYMGMKAGTTASSAT